MGLHQCRCEDGVVVPCICIRNDDHDEKDFDVPEEPVVEVVPLSEPERPAEPEGITTTESPKKKK